MRVEALPLWWPPLAHGGRLWMLARGDARAQLLVPPQGFWEGSCTCWEGGHWGGTAAPEQPAEVGLGLKDKARVPGVR